MCVSHFQTMEYKGPDFWARWHLISYRTFTCTQNNLQVLTALTNNISRRGLTLLRRWKITHKKLQHNNSRKAKALNLLGLGKIVILKEVWRPKPSHLGRRRRGYDHSQGQGCNTALPGKAGGSSQLPQTQESDLSCPWRRTALSHQ